MTRRPTLAIALLALGVTACGTTPPTRYLTLSDIAPSTPPARRADSLVLAPPTVRWPAALDRLEVARPAGGVEVSVPELTRWSAAPARLASDALIVDLTRRLPGLSFALRSDPDAATVDVEIQAIERRADGYGLLATAVITAAHGAPRRRVLSLVAAGVPTADGEAEAVSGMIAAMADQLAEDLLAGVPAGPGTPRPHAEDLPRIRP
jgi:uncharacterized lipoprotein YmbA